MKKIKNILLILLILTAFIGLTGCTQKSDKITATMTKYYDNNEKVLSTIEITFKKNIANKFIMTIEFEKEESAKEHLKIYETLGLDINNEDLKINRNGKIVVYDMSANYFSEMMNHNEKNVSLTKESITEWLKNSGYTIK